MIDIFIQLAYLLASVLFIFALRSLSRPDTARRGMQLAAVGMLIAVLATLLHTRIVTYEWILIGAAVGALIGYPLGMWVPMTAMPQRIAFSHAFGALAATLVGIGEYAHLYHDQSLTRGVMTALGFEVLLGALTVTGSLMAFGKLQELLPGRPITFPLQNYFNLALFALGVAGLVWVVLFPYDVWVFGLICVIGLLLSDDRETNKRIVELYRDLVEEARGHGWAEYRTPVAFQDLVAATYDYEDHALLRLHERLKDALDPQGVLSPGRYGIWPRQLREKRKRDGRPKSSP